MTEQMIRLPIRDKLEQIYPMVDPAATGNDGLFSGTTGALLFQWYYHFCFELDMDKPMEALVNLFEQLNSGQSSLGDYSLANGLSGFGLLVNHLERNFDLGIDLDQVLGPIDEMIYQCLLAEIPKGHMDFFHQSSGALHYLGKRLPNPRVREYLKELIPMVLKHGIQDEHGFRYVSAVGAGENKAFDMGFSHGLVGLLLAMDQIYSAGLKTIQCREILEKGLDFVCFGRQQMVAKADERQFPISIYPIFLNKDSLEPQSTNRLAYCYGDLNPLLLFTKLGKTLGLSDQLYLLLSELKSNVCARRSLQTCSIDDAHFCHGASGLAQVFLSLYHLNQDPLYNDTYEYWIRQTTILLDQDLQNNTYQGRGFELLEGLAGIGLVLLSYLFPKRYRWHEVFMLP